MRFRILLWIVPGFVLLWFLCPRPVLMNAIEGRVVDARTGQPLPNVEILIAWQLTQPTFGGDVVAGFFGIRRATTDANGRYGFDRRLDFYVPLLLRFVANESPELIVFRGGYVPQRLVNDTFPPGQGQVSYHRFLSLHSYWNGKQITLEPQADPMPAGAATELESIRIWIKQYVGDSCRWDRVAPMLLAMDAAHHDPSSLQNEENAAAKCGQVEEFERR